jgi:hypothetical protein
LSSRGELVIEMQVNKILIKYIEARIVVYNLSCFEAAGFLLNDNKEL